MRKKTPQRISRRRFAEALGLALDTSDAAWTDDMDNLLGFRLAKLSETLQVWHCLLLLRRPADRAAQETNSM